MKEDHLAITILDDNTLFDYMSDGEKIFSYNHPIGIKHAEEKSLNISAESELSEGVLHVMSQISLYERIPTTIHLYVERHSPWFKKAIENISYAQFYTSGNAVRVIINKVKTPQLSYARHTKTIFSFKI